MVSIRKIKSFLDASEGPASPAKFVCSILAPTALGFDSTEISQLLTEVTELPGRQIAATDQMIYGVKRKMPYGVVYNDLPVTFLCANDMAIRSFFDQWQSIITDPTNNYFNYYDSYIGTIVLTKIDEENNFKYFLLLEEVYPLTIESQPLDSNAGDQFMRLTVQFAYRRWRGSSDLQVAGDAFNFNQGDVFDGGGTLEVQAPFKNSLHPTPAKGPLTEE